MTLIMRYAVRSDRGLVRTNNEDSVYAGPRLLAIADGMGGHAAGEVASKIVIGTLEALDEDRPMPDIIGTLRETVADANAALAQTVAHDHHLDGMGTTLTAIRFSESRIAVVHVGDSRAYLVRNGQLSQITHDDTYVQSLVDSGELTLEEAAHHPRKSVILRAMTGADIDPDISIREARHGDRYLLCTDGLTDVLTSPTLLETLLEGGPQGCADRLVELALRGGGPDNVTCIVADVLDDAGGEVADDRPIIGGAVVEPGAEVASTADSPASRAARMSRVEPAALEPAVRPRWRRLLIGGVVLAVLLGAGITGWSWTQRQFFVGRDGQEVAVLKGINAHFGPVSFSTVVENTDIRLTDLTQAARGQVSNGIVATNRDDASAIVRRLHDELRPLCPASAPSTAPSSGPSSAETSHTPTSPTPSKGASGSANPSAAPSTGASDGDGCR